jgi:hypothetical protein
MRWFVVTYASWFKIPRSKSKRDLKSESVQHNEFDIERAESGVHVPQDHAARTPQEGQQYATRNVDLIWVRTGQSDEAILGLKLC